MKRFGIILIFILSMMVNIYYGVQKSGFHEDEYYTYFSSNRSLGLYQPDREWQDRQNILDEFAVKEGEGFNYGLVKLVQSWDVHPPLYYWIFHTICSFKPGIFSKWSGIITNLLAFSIAFYLLYLLLRELSGNYAITALALSFWGMNPQTVSCNMLIRMYAWLSVFVFACALLHVRMIKDGQSIKRILGIMLASFLGFLTQYFYLFFFVAIGFSYTVYNVFFRKKIKESALYVTSCAVSLMLAVVAYPSCLSHMFGGYRGSDAAGSMFDIGNTFMRVSFFTGLLNDFVFAGGLLYIAIALIAVYLIKLIRKKLSSKNSLEPAFICLILGAAGYFLLTSKAALLVGAASNRYEMPVYGIIVAIVFVLFQKLMLSGKEVRYVVKKRSIIIAAVICLLLLAKGHFVDGRVLFLYPEDVQKIAYAKDNKDETAVVMFNPASAHNVWRLTDELLMYSKVFYMDEENLEMVVDETVAASDKIILYVADDDVQSDAITMLMECAELCDITEISSEDMWTTYELGK